MASLPEHNAYFPSASAAYGEAVFICPGNLISGSYATFLSPSQVWNYRYNVLQDEYVAAGFGVFHVSEIVAVFGIANPADNVGSSYLTYNADTIPVVMNYWISFVRALSPNTYKYADAPSWESFGNGTGSRLMIQTNATQMEMVPQDQTDRCAFWKGLSITMEQ